MLMLELFGVEKMLNVNEAAKKLSVSTATIRNWVKLGRIKSVNGSKNRLFFEEKEVEKLLSDIISGKTNSLTKRRNKKAIKGLNLYADYIADDGKNILIGSKLVDKNPTLYSKKNIRILIANLALSLYLQAKNLPLISLPEFMTQNKSGCMYELIKELLSNISFTELDVDWEIPAPTFMPYQDFLGFIYISVSSLADRKITGVYYTPNRIVNKLLDSVKTSAQFNNGNVIDLCCGTGNFLLSALRFGVTIDRLYGKDIDEISVLIAKLNLCINGVDDIQTLNKHIKCGDSLHLMNRDERKYDLIIGNPPYGYQFSETELNVLKKDYEIASEKSVESYDLFMELSLSIINNNGLIAYVLPEAILNVKAHQKIRRFIKNATSIRYVNYIGNAFNGVACPCILIVLKKDSKSSIIGCEVEYKSKKFTIRKSRNLTENYWNFSITDEEFDCLVKIDNVKNSFTLKNQADFALGIVTGDNKKYITNVKSENNEIVLKGSDLHKYYFNNNSNNYIRFVPEHFQQVAPVEKYRAQEKLLYRFICAEPTFSYDANQTLSLNSANILIPHVKNVNIKYILAILNSKTISFYCHKKYNSIKLLRSHIENIPFPMPSKVEQDEIISLVDELLNLKNNNILDRVNIYNKIETHVMRLYGLNDSEKAIINSFSETIM